MAAVPSLDWLPGTCGTSRVIYAKREVNVDDVKSLLSGMNSLLQNPRPTREPQL